MSYKNTEHLENCIYKVIEYIYFNTDKYEQTIIKSNLLLDSNDIIPESHYQLERLGYYYLTSIPKTIHFLIGLKENKKC